MSLGNQMDAIFHEVQHSFMFASGGFRGYTGRGTPTIAGFHHGAMMQGSLWIDHANFVTKANRRFNTNINIDEIWINTLWNALPGQIKEKVAAHKKVRY
jgi:hypothetical protein